VWSAMIDDEFEAEGLPTDFLARHDTPLPAVSVALNMDGDRGFVSHWPRGPEADGRLEERALSIVGTVDARHLHAQVDDMPALEGAARSRGMTLSVDAYDGASWASSRAIAELLRDADVLLANEAEACAMAGTTDAFAALELLSSHCGCVVIRRGARGAIGIAGGDLREVPADPVDVVDTTGAGDCFNAGFLAGWLSGMPIEHSLTLGVICGSGSVTDFGGYRGCPRAAELRAIAAKRGIVVPDVWEPVEESA
jgi:sugar/nucleoside kinase (ribokinase family)